MSGGHVFDGLPAPERERLESGGLPDRVEPMLAKLTERRFSDESWIFERKLDGERCLALSDGGELRLVSRNGNPVGSTYPELRDALARQERDAFVLDGEVVAFSGKTTSFSRLQPRMQAANEKDAVESGVKVYYYLFDILYLDGYDTRRLPLRRRKQLLRRAFSFPDPLRFTVHRNTNGVPFYREACRKGWEGIIAKDARSEYVAGRSGKWLKLKCVRRQEFVIGGFTDPEGERRGFGALLIGYYDDDDLVYAGKVGTGYDDELLERLSERLKRLERKTAPFGRGGPPEDGVHWVTPKLTGEVGFTEWTDDGKLRHPRFLGTRRDKEPRDVVREAASEPA